MLSVHAVSIANWNRNKTLTLWDDVSKLTPSVGSNRLTNMVRKQNWDRKEFISYLKLSTYVLSMLVLENGENRAI